jgi:hypothetical protein
LILSKCLGKESGKKRSRSRLLFLLGHSFRRVPLIRPDYGRSKNRTESLAKSRLLASIRVWMRRRNPIPLSSIYASSSFRVERVTGCQQKTTHAPTETLLDWRWLLSRRYAWAAAKAIEILVARDFFPGRWRWLYSKEKSAADCADIYLVSCAVCVCACCVADLLA